MSDVGRKMDVEDVLSSIRRLVSEEARNAPDTPESAPNTQNDDPDLLRNSNETNPEKLVLTPSLRVTEAITPPPVAAEIEQRIADIESLVMSEAVASAQAEIMDAVELQDPVEDDAKSDNDAAMIALDTDEQTPVAEPHTLHAGAEMMSALHLSMNDFARAEPPLTANISEAPMAQEPEAQPEPEMSQAEPAPEASFAEILVDSVTFEAEVQFEESMDIPDFNEAPDADVQETAEHVEDVSHAVESIEPLDIDPQHDAQDPLPEEAIADQNESRAEPETEQTDTTIEEPQRSTIVNREPVFTAPEPAEEETPNLAMEPDHDPALNFEFEAVPQEDTAAAADVEETLEAASNDNDFNDLTADDADAPQTAFPDEPVDYTAAEEAFVDEDMLREMVSDMVRSELQGELGDRITRNVRKLVRREIYRALASRDFE